MSERCLSNTSKAPQFSCLLISDLFLFCSLILSQPLYFSYFIFFSPYLFKLLFILSPLFITTSLLHLTFLTISFPDIIQEHSLSELSEIKLSFFLKTYHTMLERLLFQKNDGCESDFLCMEEFEALKIVFDPSKLDFGGSPAGFLVLTSDEESSFYDFGAPTFCSLSRESESAVDKTSICEESANKLEENCGETAPVEIGIKDAMEEKTSEVFFKELDDFDSMTSNGEVEKDHEPPPCAEFKKIVKIIVAANTGEKSSLGGSEVSDTLINADTNVSAQSQRFGLGEFVNSNGPDNAGERTPKIESSRALEYNIWTYCSMRKEKEWKRTLACKLFEERHNNIADGSGEGMDLLWETYEMDSRKSQPKGDIIIQKKSNNEEKTKKLFDYDERVDERVEDMFGPFCCLGALKSAGKMNLGMGRSDLFRMFRAVKWCRWLHHVIRHSKKIHHGD